jgi:uncharacterized RDD family membrane protein YckC
MSETTTPAGRPLVPGTASWPRRVIALVIDWLACFGVAAFILRDVQSPGFTPLLWGLFLTESAVGMALTGASFGQTLMRITVHRLDGRPLSLLAALGRQALILLLVPPLVFRGDGRGLHDIVTDSAAFPRP